MNQHDELNQPEELNQPGESFEELEQHLTKALRRVDAPDGFAERTMTRIRPSESAPAKVIVMRPRPRIWASGAVAAALLAGIFFVDQNHLRHQREEAELAQRQFEAGMRITDRALEHTRQQLRHAGVQVGN